MPDQCSRHETGQDDTNGGMPPAVIMIITLTASPAVRIG